MFEGFWELFGMFLEVVGRHSGDFGRSLESVWEVCRRCLRGFGRCL